MYLIDGYNLIFSLIHTKMSLQMMREKVIRYLQKRFLAKSWSGLLVFDGAHQRGEESGLSYPSPLIVAYAPKGISADAYIVEQIEIAKNPKALTVITNDKGLERHAKALGARVESNEAFLGKLKKRKNLKEKRVPKESAENLRRLQRVFEERLRRNLEEENGENIP